MNLIIVFLTLLCIKSAFTNKNIILIIADDLDLTLDGMVPLKNTKIFVGDEGAVFSNCFVASPICCPNRASILTGRYQHNHLTVNNSISGGCSSPHWQNVQESNTFATALKNQKGYLTFYAGKYLNQYGDKSAGGAAHVPPGWDWWAGLVGNSKYYNYSLSINGTERKYGIKPEEYLTDVISDLAVDFIKTRHSTEKPFLMVLAPPAPHSPFIPAARHNDKYKGLIAKKTPNFNTLSQKNKHWLVRMGPSPLPKSVLNELNEVYRRRWETLLAVDELVGNVHRTLKAINLLNDTYIIFTSDNGYHIGQFSLPVDKRQPYETDIRVPLLIRGPGIAPAKISAPVSSVDLYATILNMAGMEMPSDGTSLLGESLAADRTLLIEYRGEKSKGIPSSGCPSDRDLNLSNCNKDMACKCEDAANNTFSCIRRVSYYNNNIFCIFEDDQAYIEAYDLNIDAYQLNNIGYSMNRGRRHKFRNRLKKIVTCRDANCVVTNSEYERIHF